MTQQQASLGLRIAIVIGLAILFPATVYYGVSTVYEPPQEPPYEAPQIMDGDGTEATGPALNEEYEDSMEAYRAEQQAFDLGYFWVAVPLGFLALCAGFFPRLADVGTGLVFAGLVNILMGHLGAWDSIGNELRFFSLLISLLLLLAVSYRRILQRPQEN